MYAYVIATELETTGNGNRNVGWIIEKIVDENGNENFFHVMIFC